MQDYDSLRLALWFVTPWLEHRHTDGFWPAILLAQPAELNIFIVDGPFYLHVDGDAWWLSDMIILYVLIASLPSVHNKLRQPMFVHINMNGICCMSQCRPPKIRIIVKKPLDVLPAVSNEVTCISVYHLDKNRDHCCFSYILCSCIGNTLSITDVGSDCTTLPIYIQAFHRGVMPTFWGCSKCAIQSVFHRMNKAVNI